MPYGSYSEADLHSLIDQKLKECREYPNVYKFIQMEGGWERVKERIWDMIFKDGITSIDTAIANIETELLFTEE